MAPIPTLPVNPNGAMPILGFGTWELEGDTCRKAVETAIEVGYRHIDTAHAYGNHEFVGAGIAASGVPRDQIFLTTKVFRDELHYDPLLASCDRALQQLKVDYLDLYLVHWPNKDVPMDETFRAMGKLINDGKIRACGVSNFTASRLQSAMDLGLAPIACNQVEYNPLLNQKGLHKFCQEHNVVLTGYSPLARGTALDNEDVQAVAHKCDRTPSQVILRWLLQRGIVAIPKATSREHIQSNFQVFDFNLSPEDFTALDSIQAWERLISWNVAEFDK